MIKAISLFPKSIDSEWLDEYLGSEMAPSLKKMPGFQSIKFSKGDLMSPAGPPAYSKVVEFTFDSLENFMAWAQSSTAQMEKDNIIRNGTILLYYEMEEI